MNMLAVKRPLSIDQFPDEKAKKLRTTSNDRKVISTLEKLPNELFYEIFDYLDGCRLYEAFSNLNTRFENLLDCSSLKLKIRHHSYPEDQAHRFSHIITSKRHKILSLKFFRSVGGDEKFPQFNIDSSFSCLESLILENIKPDDVLPLLVGLSSLPRLYALTIEPEDTLEDIGNMYQAIFQLPTLKYIKISFFPMYFFETFIPLPIASNNQWTTIEYLSVHHCCALDELIVILTYTPQLRRLSCTQVNDTNEFIRQQSLNIRSNLTHIFISRCVADFDDMEIFMTKISPHLQVLDIACSRDAAYLDADRWERIISEHLLQLRVFNFKYEETIDEDLEATVHHERINRFNSTFWTKRNWFLHLYLDTDVGAWMDDMTIVYSVSPYRKNVQENLLIDQDQSTELPARNQLTVTAAFAADEDQSIFDNLGPILITAQINCLKITCEEIFIGTLIDLIRYLPNLHSLFISSLSMTQPRCLSADEVAILRSILENNTISRVNLQRMNDLSQVQFLLELCPRVEYFEVDCTNAVYPEEVIRFILMKNTKYIPNLSSLCLNIVRAKASLVDHLTKIIDFERLHQNYTIRQTENKIYLQWN